MTDTENTFINKADRVILYDALGSEVIHDILWGSDDYGAKFLEQFEVLEGRTVSDPNEDYYQGINLIRLIRRKADGRLFGFQYWEDISKHGDAEIEANGDEHGLEFEPPSDFDWVNGYFPQAYVFLPVEPFTVTGYQVVEVAK